MKSPLNKEDAKEFRLKLLREAFQGNKPVDVSKELRSALSLMLTYFGMDESSDNKEVFDAARRAIALHDIQIGRAM